MDKLLKARLIKEVNYPDWLSNIVLVKKSNGKWRMCVDFTDLNKAYPKDNFPLPRIDQMVDSTSGHDLLSFMDAFSGYNQIMMDVDDREKTSFITDKGIYCYRAMPFGLKMQEQLISGWSTECSSDSSATLWRPMWMTW